MVRRTIGQLAWANRIMPAHIFHAATHLVKVFYCVDCVAGRGRLTNISHVGSVVVLVTKSLIGP